MPPSMADRGTVVVKTPSTAQARCVTGYRGCVNAATSDATEAGGASAVPGASRPPGTTLLRAGAAAFALVVISWVVYDIVSGPGGALNVVDLTVYRDGGLIVRHVRPYYDPNSYAPLYDWGGFSPLALKFTYTPFAAIFFAVASIVPLGALEAASVAGNMLALVAALWFTFGGLGYRDRRVRLGAALLAAAATFWLQPVVRTIYLGQINLILLAAIMGDLCQPEVTASGRRRWWKGALTGVAAGIKLVPLIFVPYLLLTRRFREAAATLVGFAVTVGIGFAVLPHDSDQWWLHGKFLSDGSRAGFMGWAGNQSLRAIVTRFAGSVAAGQAPWLVAAAIALIVGLTAAWLLDRAGLRVPALLATALTGLLISPISWDHHWVWIAPAVATAGHYAVTAARAGAKRAPRACWALAAAMMIVYAAWPDAIWEAQRTLGRFSLGFLWAQQNTDPLEFATRGDKPYYVEYHWHGFQLLWGNIYILGGIALLLILLGIGFRLRQRPPETEAHPTRPISAAV
jgi:alpha-1,2-mannosyltransferase